MAVNMQIATATRNAMCNAAVDLLDASGTGTIKVYTGTQPATANTGLSGNTLLATFTCSATAFGSASSGVATLAGVTLLATAGNSGTATWFRAADGGGTTVFDGSCGTATADMILNTTSIVSGSQVQLISGTVTMPAS